MSIEIPIENKVLNQAQHKLTLCFKHVNFLKKSSTNKSNICMKMKIPIEIDIIGNEAYIYRKQNMSIYKNIN